MIKIRPFLGLLNDKFNHSGYQLYLVGGAIRNELIGLPIDEWDFATDAIPSETEEVLRQSGAKNIGLIGERFGTVTADFQGEKVEITTYRGETYRTDSRQPDVKWGKSITEDLERRDFTINALAYDFSTKKIMDLFNGQGDLKDKVIAAVGKAGIRFEEDPLRMLRAIRFACQLGFTIEPETLGAITRQKERLAVLSAERIAGEMDKILLSPKPSDGIKLLVETGVISYILPELIPTIDLEFDPTEHKDIYRHILQVLDNTPTKLALRWSAILHDIAKPLTRKKVGNDYHFLGHENVGAKVTQTVLRRLKYSNDFIEYVTKLVRLHQRLPNNDGRWTDGAVRRFVRDAGEALEDLFLFAKADSTGGNERKLARYQQMRDELWSRIVELNKQAEINKIKSPLDGEELMKMFHRPAGPWIKEIKQHLLDLVLDGQLEGDDKKAAAKIASRQLGVNDPP